MNYRHIFPRICAVIFILSFFFDPSSSLADDFQSKRKAMLSYQITGRGIRDNRVIEAMRKVERHRFVPEDMQVFAYEDRPLPIGLRQTISQPYIVAYMTEALKLEKNDRVLEIGTGSGYQAAILAEIVNMVYTIEIIPELSQSSSKLLKELGYHNIEVKTGDGYLGWPDKAPFDAIMVTAAPPEVPEKLVEQLVIGGRMVLPVGAVYQELYLITKTERGARKERLAPVRFVPMVHGE